MNKKIDWSERRTPLAGPYKDAPRTPFSAHERQEIFAAIEQAVGIENETQFRQWAETSLRLAFPHEMFACGIGCIDGKGARIQHFIGCGFPAEFLPPPQGGNNLLHSPVFAQWLEQRQPVLFEPGPEANVPAEYADWLAHFRLHELHNIAAHGQRDIDSDTTSYFSFSRIPAPLTAQHAHMLRLLVPHMHLALIQALDSRRISASHAVMQQYPLTRREKEILHWLCSGRTNCEISEALSISPSTVKNHIHRILDKLGVSSRTQAVTKAIEMKLASLPRSSARTSKREPTVKPSARKA